MDQFSFEKLEVWQLSRILVGKIYSITKSFPDSERFGLINQIRRASISISSNLAEGTSRMSTKDQAHFSQLAYSSLMELANQIILANDLTYIDENQLSDLREYINELSNKINALYKYQKNRKKQ